MALTEQIRSPHSPSPIYGIRPGFTVGDLEAARVTALHVYGTFVSPGSDSLGLPTVTWNTETGRWDVVDVLSAQATASDAAGTIISPNARVVKVSINVTAAAPVATNHVVISFKTSADSYGATIFTSGSLGAGSYEFMVGGWATPSGDGSSYVATQYVPPSPTTALAQDNPAFPLPPSQDNNYVGGTYNPFQLLSLDGASLKFFAAVTGTVGYDVSVTAVS